jgi:dCTP diphosphatase
MTPIPESQDLRALTRLVREFADARDWEQFHTPKNLAMALAVEAAELMEPLQWLTPDEATAVRDDPTALAHLSEEMADVAIYLIRMADVLGVDLGGAIEAKVGKNAARYPVDLVKGKSRRPEGDAG